MKEEQLNLLNKNLKQKVEELEEVERSNKELKEKLKSLQVLKYFQFLFMEIETK